MSDINNIVLSGRLTSDPETREFESTGNNKTSFSLASNRRWGDKEDTTFVDVDCWGKLAEVVAKFCAKGKPVSVVGRLCHDTWTNNEGQKRSKLYLTATDVSFGPKPAEGGDTGGDSKEAIREVLKNVKLLIDQGVSVDAALAAVAG